MRSANKLGSVYRCPVCGAEVSVIRHGKGVLGPYCCDEAMELIEQINTISRCTLCASEIMTIKEEPKGKLEPFCCDKLMAAINA